MLLNIFLFFCKYPRIPVDIKKLCGYSHNRYLTNMDTGMANIYPIDKILRSYYSYPTRLVDIP